MAWQKLREAMREHARNRRGATARRRKNRDLTRKRNAPNRKTPASVTLTATRRICTVSIALTAPIAHPRIEGGYYLPEEHTNWTLGKNSK